MNALMRTTLICSRGATPLRNGCFLGIYSSASRLMLSLVVRASFATTTSAAAADDNKYQYIVRERRGIAEWVILNRPDLHNSFNEVVIKEITDAFTSIAKQVNNNSSSNSSAPPRAVVLTGNGASFSAGADLNWMKKMASYTEEENHRDSLALFEMVEAVRYCPLPVIGRVNGAALGGGSGLVAACDIAIATENATFGFTEVKLGLVPAVISRFVIDRIGQRGAARYFLTGERFDAKEAQRIGLVQNHLPSLDAVDQEVNRLIEEFGKNSPAAVKISKELIEKVSSFPSAASTKSHVASVIAKVRVSPEGQEGLSSFLQKRKPSWSSSSKKTSSSSSSSSSSSPSPSS
eukprot:TRINITY_DN2802_c0_g1_i1.p1 TRINITY_DN2802_c0_g1~~TRINITY_DN2802_c0_g1_i1.p1  ORF type:complete len:361 (-),score=99.58 TRINITY_DN2802_c0_g1_i1:163-1206(-)